MAAGKFKLYHKAKFRIGDGTLDLDDTANWKMALFLAASNCNTLSVGTGVYGDLTSEVATAFGYTIGGTALTPTWTDVSGVETFDTTNAAWTASGGSIVARYAVIYKNATVNSIVKPLLAVCVLDTTPADRTATTGQVFTVAINASGVFSASGATTD